VIDLQKPFARKKAITNSLQTNGTLLNDEWGDFLKRHNFMVASAWTGRNISTTAIGMTAMAKGRSTW